MPCAAAIGADGIVIGRQAEQIDRNDRARLKPSACAAATARSQLAGSRLKVSGSTSAMIGVAPKSATISAVA